MAMTHEVRAIYENGQFRPLEPVALPEHGLVSLVITSAGTGNATPSSGNKENLQAALDRVAQLPIEGPDDGFSGADHDLVLYGWKK